MPDPIVAPPAGLAPDPVIALPDEPPLGPVVIQPADPAPAVEAPPAPPPERLPDLETTASTSRSTLMLALLTRPDIKTIGDLNDKAIGLDRTTPVDADLLRKALRQGGAPDTRLTNSDRSDIDRLLAGEVQAIVLWVRPREENEGAAAKPAVEGYNVLTLPLPARAEAAEPAQPGEAVRSPAP